MSNVRRLHDVVVELHARYRQDMPRHLLDRVIAVLGYDPARDEKLLELGKVQLQIMSTTRRMLGLRMGKTEALERERDRVSKLIERREVLLTALFFDTHVPELDE